MPGSSLTCQSNVGRPVTFTGFHGHIITFTPSCGGLASLYYRCCSCSCSSKRQHDNGYDSMGITQRDFWRGLFFHWADHRSPTTYIRWNLEKPGPITEQPIVKFCSEPLAMQWFYDSSCGSATCFYYGALPTMGTFALAPSSALLNDFQHLGWGEFLAKRHDTPWDFVYFVPASRYKANRYNWLGNTGGIWAFQGYLLKSHLNILKLEFWMAFQPQINTLICWVKCQMANFHWLLLEHIHGHHYLGCVAIVFKGLHVITWDQGGGGGRW